MFYPETVSESQKLAQWEAATQPEASFSEVALAGISAGFEMTIPGAIGETLQATGARMNTSSMIPKDVANEQLKQYNISFDRDISEAELKWHTDKQEKIKSREAILSSVKDNFFKKTVSFGSTLATAALDPVAIALGGAMSVGVKAAVGTKLGSAFLYGTEASRAMLVAKGGATAQFAGAALGNVAAEMTVASMSEARKTEYTMQEAVLNATIGTAVVMGGIAGLGKLASTVKSLKPKALNAINETASQLIEANKNPAIFADTFAAAVAKADEITPELTTLIRKHFPEQAERLLSLKTTKEIVNQASQNPYFAKELVDMDLNHKAYLKNDPELSDYLSKSQAEELSTKYSARETDVDYNPEVARMMDEIPEDLPEDFGFAQMDEDYKILRDTIEADDIAKSNFSDEIKAIDSDVEFTLKEIKATMDLAKCRSK